MAGRDVGRKYKDIVPDGFVDNPLLVEAVALANDACFDTPFYRVKESFLGTAPLRGWIPLELGQLAPNGVQLVDLSGSAAEELGPITSAAHVYVGELEGLETLAISFRGSDEGGHELSFLTGYDPKSGSFGSDAYAAAHAPLVEAALRYAADPANGIERILLTGHGLGGVLAERLGHEVVASSPLAAIAEIVTFGSPGSPGTSDFGNMLHIVHGDDLMARLSDLSPLFAALGVAREGVDAVADRPESSLPAFRPEDLDTAEEILAAALDPKRGLEHRLALYADTALAMSEAERIVPGVADRPGDPERWLALPAHTRFVLGTARADLLEASGDPLEVVLGGRGPDRLVGTDGTDRLGGGGGADRLFGGNGDDVLEGGQGFDLIEAGDGDDRIVSSPGFDTILGGAGTDTVVLPGDPDDFRIRLVGETAIVRQPGVGQLALLRDVELVAFADGTVVPIRSAAGEPGWVGLDSFLAAEPGPAPG